MFEWSWTEATQDLWRSGHFLLTNKKTLVISLHIKSLAKNRSKDRTEDVDTAEHIKGYLVALPRQSSSY
jgi:hypothetical protein